MINVYYNAKRDVFNVTLPYMMNDLIMEMAGRKYDVAEKCWKIPAVVQNALEMKRTLANAQWTPESLAKLAALTERKDNPAPIFPVNYIYKTKPREYQKTAIKAAFGKTAFALFMGMGTGKTKTTIDIIKAGELEGLADAALIICPLSIRNVWESEIEKHSDNNDIHLLNTGNPDSFNKWLASPAKGFRWLLVSVESLGSSRRSLDMCRKYIEHEKYIYCTVDESSKIKTPSAKRSRACHELGRKCAYKLILTGTPIAKGIEDLYSQFQFLDPGIIGIGSYYSFRAKYCVMGGYENRQIVGYRNIDNLMARLRDNIIQIKKEDVLNEIPDKIRTARKVEMTPMQVAYYKQIELSPETNDSPIKNALEKALRLRQVSGGFYVEKTENEEGVFSPPLEIPGNNPKLNELKDLLSEFEGQAIIWCAFRAEITLIAEALRKIYGKDQVLELHGGISEKDRKIYVDDLFQQGKARFIVGNAATGGMGLTMTAATLCIYFSNTFNFIDREQSEDRAHRMGQHNAVTYIDLVATFPTKKKSIDEHILDALSHKKNLSEYVKERIDNGESL